MLVDSRVLAGMNVSTPDVVDTIKLLIESGRTVDAMRLANPLVQLADA
jgi:hypothetical protein